MGSGAAPTRNTAFLSGLLTVRPTNSRPGLFSHCGRPVRPHPVIAMSAAPTHEPSDIAACMMSRHGSGRHALSICGDGRSVIPLVEAGVLHQLQHCVCGGAPELPGEEQAARVERLEHAVAGRRRSLVGLLRNFHVGLEQQLRRSCSLAVEGLGAAVQPHFLQQPGKYF